MPKRTKQHELLDFEISFFERLLSVYPNFVDALTPLAEAYTRRGMHEKGLELDLRIIRLRERDPLAWYNLACSYSLLSRIDEALGALRQALALGYHDFTFLSRDPDLLNLRRSPKFRPFLESLLSRQTT